MKCQDYQELLSAYLDRELAQSDQKDVTLHLENCSACKGELSSLLVVKEKLRGARLPSMPADLVAQIEAQTLLRSAWWEKWLLWGIPAVAAAAALGIGAILFMRASVEPHIPPNVPLALLQRRQQYLADQPQLAWHTPSDSDTAKDVQ